MSGILFFIFASCHPLSLFKISTNFLLYIGVGFLLSFSYVCLSLNMVSTFFLYSADDYTTVHLPLSAPTMSKSFDFLSLLSATLSSLEILDLGGLDHFNVPATSALKLCTSSMIKPSGKMAKAKVCE